MVFRFDFSFRLYGSFFHTPDLLLYCIGVKYWFVHLYIIYTCYVSEGIPCSKSRRSGGWSGEKKQKTHVQAVELQPNASFEEVLAALKTHFEVTDATSVRVGQLKSPSVSTFDGQQFTTYLKSKGLYLSQVKLYLETEEKFRAPTGQLDR